MKENLFENETAEDRLQMLQDNCCAQESTLIKRFHTTEEKESLRSQATNEMIRCQEIEDEIKAVALPLKNELKEIKSELRGHLRRVKNGYEEESVVLYQFDDQEEGMMGYYDAAGNMVSSRRLYPNERQTRIVDMHKQNNL